MPKKSKRIRNTIVTPNTKEERQKIIAEVMMTVSILDITDLIKQYHVDNIFNEYIEKGETINTEVPMKDHGRTLIIKLYKSRNKPPFIDLHRDKIEVERKSKIRENIDKIDRKIKELKDNKQI